MNMIEVVLAMMILTVAIGFVGWVIAGRRAAAAERRQRPARLRDAELVFVERQFRSLGRWPVIARVDRVYRKPSGILVLVELKTRASPVVTRSDVILRIPLIADTHSRLIADSIPGDRGHLLQAS